jgi:outer membrane autotransporter protein
VWNFYGEAGYRWEFSPNFAFTPFVGVDVGHAELDEFTEDDPHGTGWALHVDGGEADSVETLVGVRFGGWWDIAGGVFRPDVMVAWAHEFDDPAEVDVSFRDGPPGAEFSELPVVAELQAAQHPLIAEIMGLDRGGMAGDRPAMADWSRGP